MTAYRNHRSFMATAALTLVLVAAGLGASASGGSPAAPTSRPLATGIVDPVTFGREEDASAAFANARRTGAGVVRLVLHWPAVAPPGQTRPPGFRPRRPDDPRYRWGGFDRVVTEAVRAGLEPLVDIMDAPEWAQRKPEVRRPQDGPYFPSHTALADFAFAAARRYGGEFRELPRVRLWQVWNEPNFSFYLTPQEENGKLQSAAWYRAMVNQMAKSIHAVHPDNLVVTGGLAPYGATTETLDGIAPLRFMRALLCMSAGPKPKRTCSQQISFDAWSHHPYTSGGPTRHASRPDDVSIGDLGEMNALLRAAERAGAIRSNGRVRFWVTEFAWDTAPPDPKGVPIKLHARWMSEALYRMWHDGVQLVTWYQLRDEPFPQVSTQSGLYFRGGDGIRSDRPKLSMQAFRFPFVAFREKNGRIFFWGRTPTSETGSVLIERSVPGGWQTATRLRAPGSGVFQGRFGGAGRGASVRARLVLGGERSVPFSLRVPPDRNVCPFGTC